jgi:hypothetical protein
MDRGEDSGVMRRADVLLEAQIEADESSSIEESTPEVAAPVLARAQLALGNRGLLAAISGNASTPWLRQWRNAVMFERAGVSADNLLTNAAMLAMMRHTQEEEQEAFKLPASAGDKLPDVLRAKFEAAFGHDFSHVRVHTTSSAAKASMHTLLLWDLTSILVLESGHPVPVQVINFSRMNLPTSSSMTKAVYRRAVASPHQQIQQRLRLTVKSSAWRMPFT